MKEGRSGRDFSRSTVIFACLLLVSLLLPVAGEQGGAEVAHGHGEKGGGGGGGGAGGCKKAKTAQELIEASGRLTRKGKHAKAVSCLEHGARKFVRDSGMIWEELGILQEDGGMIDDAANSFRRAREADPSLSLSALRLGNILSAVGERDAEAIELFREASNLRPESPIPHNNIGLALTRMGDVDGAIAAFHLGLASTEDGAYGRGMIHSNLGHLYQSMSRPDLAIASLEMAIAEGPTIETFCNLGTALIDVGDHARAEQVMRQGLQMVEGERVSEAVIVAMRVLARALVMQERIDQALGVLSEVGSGLASDDFLFAASALARFDLGGALRCLASALRLNPHSPKALKEAGVTLYGLGRYSEAEALFKRIIALPLPQSDPAKVEAYNGLGASIEMSHSRLDEAVVHYRKAHESHADFTAPFFSLVHLLGRICDWRSYQEDFDKMRGLIRSGTTTGIGPIFALAYPLEEGELCAVVQSRSDDVEAAASPLRPYFTAWSPNFGSTPEKLAIGVISADFNARPVGQLVQGMFGKLDRSKFEVFAFGLSPTDGSRVLANIYDACDEFYFVRGMASLGIAELVNSAQVHILIDLNGYTDGGRQEVMALGPAAVSVNYLGYPYTLSIPGVDYVLTDRIATAPEQMSCFTEKAAMLPNTYMVNDYRQSQTHQINGSYTEEDAAALGAPHHHSGLLFANFNHLQKLGPATFQLWARIMQRTPGSKLWLLRFPKEAEVHLKREASERGVDQERVMFTGKFADDEHLKVKRGASMLLDTLEYNAHVSGLDALWSGLPMVTLPGSNMARRCGASFLRTQRISSLVARTPEDYVDIAVSLATSSKRLDDMRARTESARMGGRLFDTEGWVREFERMMVLMWDTRASVGRGGYHIAVSGFTGWDHAQL